MSSVASLAERLKQDRPAFTAWCGMPNPAAAGVLAREAFDAVTFDMQHAPVDFAAVASGIPLVAAAGKPALARVPVGAFATASRLLDAGASGIIAPMVNTVEDARLLAAFTKFPPVGERSWGPAAALALTGLAPGAYFSQANGFSITIAMIETREALGLIDEILGVPGIDGVFLGPSDLSIALSDGAGVDPLSSAVESALDHALARARAAGKIAGVYAHSGERAGELARRGFPLVAIGSDVTMLRAGAQSMLRAARGM